MSWIIYSMLNILLKLQQHNIISSGDYYFAELIAEKQRPFNYPEPIQQLAVLVAALANYSYQQGNTCLYLDHKLLIYLFRNGNKNYSVTLHFQSSLRTKSRH